MNPTAATASDLARPRGGPGLGLQLALLTIAVGAGGFARMALSPLQEAVRLGLGLSDNQVAALQGLAPAVPIVLFSTPLGMLVDHTRRTWILAAMAALAAAGTALSAVAPSYAVLFLARMMVGLGVAGALPAAVSLAADLFRPGQLGRVNMALGFGQTVGAALAFAAGGQLLGALAHAAGWAAWRSATMAMAAPLALIALLCLAMREPPRVGVQSTGRLDARRALRELADYAPVIIPLVIGMVTVSMADAAAGIWAAPVLTRNYHLGPQVIGGMMAGVVLVGGAAGGVLGGLLTDLGQRLGGRAGVLWVAIAATVCSTPCAAFPVMPSAAAFAVALAALLLFGGAVGVTATTAFTLAVPNELRGFTIGLVLSAGAIVSTAIAPSAVSLLSQGLGGPAHLAAALAWIDGAGSVLALAAFVAAKAALRPAADAA